MDAVVGHPVAGPAASAGRAAAVRPAAGPTVTLTRSAPCSTSPPRSEELAGLPRRGRLPGRGRGPADSRRHPARGRAPRIGRTAADRAPGQGPGMGSGRGGRRPGGCLARRATTRIPAGARPAEPRGVSEPPPTAVRIAEERRLFYVACTRARRRLVVTAVAGTEGEATSRPGSSTELGVPIRSVPGRPRRPLTFAALVAELRRTAVEPESPPALRGGRHRPAGPARRRPPTSTAGRWCRPLTPGAGGACRAQRAGAPGGGRRRSRSRCRAASWAAVLACPRQWFLARQAQAESIRNPAATFGSVVHVLAEHGAPGRAVPDCRRRAVRPSRPGLGSARLRRQLAVGGRAGRGGVGARALPGLAGGPHRPGAARHGGRLPLRGRGRRRAGPADRHGRPGGTRPGRPDPDRRLQDLQDRAARRRRRGAGPARGLPARRPGRSVRRGGRSGRPSRWGRAGLSAVAGRSAGTLPKVFHQASLDDVPFPLDDAASDSPRRTAEHGEPDRSRPGCTAGC